MGFGESLIRPMVRFGEGLGESFNTAMGASSLEKDEETKRMLVQEKIKKGVELRSLGKVDEAQKLFKSAQSDASNLGKQADLRIEKNKKGQEDIVKGAVGTAAYFVPGGKTLAGKMVAGAAGGAGAGYGMSDKDNELESTIGGAIVGGLVPVVFDQLGKVATRMQPKVKETISLIGKKVKATPSWSSSKKGLQDVAESIGINNKMIPRQMAEQLDYAFGESQKEIKRLLSESEPVSPDVVQKKLLPHYETLGITKDEQTKGTKTLLDSIIRKMNDAVGDNQAVYELKTEAAREMGNFFDKAGKNATAKQKIWNMVYKTIKDSLDTVSDPIKQINNTQQKMYQLAEEIVPLARKEGEEISVRLPWTNAGVPTGKIQESATKLGRNIQAPFKAVGSAGRTAKSGVSQFLEGASNLYNKVDPSSAVSAAIVSNQSETPQVGLGPTPQDAITSIPGGTPDVSGLPSFSATGETPSLGPSPESQAPKTLNEYGASPEKLYNAYIKATDAGDKANAKLLYQMFKDETTYQEANIKETAPKLSSTAQNQVNLAKSGARGLEEAIKLYNEDPSLLGKQKVPGQFLSRKFDSALFRSVDALLRARSGAAVPEQEVRRYMDKFAPRWGDDPETVKFKWDQLQFDFQEVIDGYTGGVLPDTLPANPQEVSF